MKKAVRTVLSLCFIVFAFLEAVDICCFQRAFYETEYSRLEIAESMQMSFEDLMQATDVLLDYTRRKREDMVVEATVAGLRREVFNDREKAHMKDVRRLYQGAMILRDVCLILIVACSLYQIVNKEDPNKTAKTFLKTSLAVSVGFVCLCMYAFSDFDRFWTQFHHVFFAGNDLWLLDPSRDLLINMVPEQFFFDLVFRIVIVFLTLFLAALISSWVAKGSKDAERGTV